MSTAAEDRPAPGRRITLVTRRDLFDYIRTDGAPWYGRLDDIAFLSRLYDLDALPSDDYRFATAREDIHQHCIRNPGDWPQDWVLTDARFGLDNGSDEQLLGFLAQMVHPVVRPDSERAEAMLSEFNKMLSRDGWGLARQGEMSGRPVYAPTLLGGLPNPAVSSAHAVAVRVDAEYIAQQVTRMEGAIAAEPELAIGTAKEFIESICKTVLDERQEPHDKHDDVLALVRKTIRCLQLMPDQLDPSAPAASTVKRMMMNLAQLVQGAAELRNTYGTGHGRSKAQAEQRLTSRHARLAVGAASTLGVFLYETHEGGGAAHATGPGL
ncbi:abortive infection family protein [Streptomyces sp. NPDC000349]|uniref:abortive infection family protein n=1 Tax=Streptomyces sp. NPDC000349 TaxID=3154249 RepID=UPI00336A2FF6